MSEEIMDSVAVDYLCKFINKEVLGNNETRDFSNEKIEEKKEFLKNNIDKLFKKTFWDFAKRDKNGDIDGDREKISSAIYWILWEDKLKKINNNYTYMNYDYEPKSDSVPGEKFSGDTICTFNTLFSGASIAWFESQNFNKEIDRTDLEEKFPLLSIFSDQELKDINKFRLLYQTLGNFYILPGKTMYVAGQNTSINTYRGNFFQWKDYFDTFLQNLKEKLDNHKFINEDFDRLIELNKFFFDNVKTYDKFIDFFMLEDFKDYKLSEHYNYNMYYVNEAKYHDFALEYIKKSTDCITIRADRMKNALITKLGLDK